LTDVAELMRRDPLLLSREDISTIVRVMRESRGRFNAGNVKAGSTKPKTEKEKANIALAEKLNLKISL